MEDTFPPLVTERLFLRRFTDGDLDAFLAYRNDPEVARYQSWESYTEEEARSLITAVKTLRPGVPGHWFQVAVELRETGELIGDLAFADNADDPTQVEVGFTFDRAHQGRGYATEAMTRLLPYLFEPPGLAQVVAIIDSLNHSAAALLQRLGFRYQETQEVTFKGCPGKEDRYVLSREEWGQSLP